MEYIGRKVFIAGGCRTPFARMSSDYRDLMAYELGAFAIKGLLAKTGISGKEIDRVIMGTVVHNVQTSNVARESLLKAGLPDTIPASTVSMACISANLAISQGIDLIRTGQADLVIAGGTDSSSDITIPFKKSAQKKFVSAQKLRTLGDRLKFVLSLRPGDFVPQEPKVAEFSTGLVMGEDCDMSARKYNISREDQDQFAVRSHQLADKAFSDGLLDDEMCPVEIKGKIIKRDNGVRGDSTFEKASKLRPAFNKSEGTLTAANSSFLSDGAAVTLLASEEKAKELGLTTDVSVLSYVFSARSPKDELLLGPAYSAPLSLDQAGLSLSEMDVIEIHEAFAAQVLYNIKAMENSNLAENKTIGKVELDKLNLWGGSLSIGHPFGATGSRLVNTAANRLRKEDGKYALIASCAAGGHGTAMVLKRARGVE